MRVRAVSEGGKWYDEQMAESLTGRRTRRARRVTVEGFDLMRAANGRAAGEPPVIVEPPEEDDEDEAIPRTGSLRTDEETSNDLEVPFEAQFASKDFLPAPGLRRVATALIARDARLRHLTGVHIEFLWKRRGGARRSIPTIGDCVMPSGLSKHAWNQMAMARTGSQAERVTFVVWLAADHLQEFTSLQVEASLYRQLLKTATDPQDHSAFKLRAPDFVGFIAEIERYGLWNQSLTQAAPAFRAAPLEQPSLFETTMSPTTVTNTVTVSNTFPPPAGTFEIQEGEAFEASEPEETEADD